MGLALTDLLLYITMGGWVLKIHTVSRIHDSTLISKPPGKMGEKSGNFLEPCRNFGISGSFIIHAKDFFGIQ